MSGILAIYDYYGELVWDTAGTNKRGQREGLTVGGSTGSVPLAGYGSFSLEVSVCPGSNTTSRH